MPERLPLVLVLDNVRSLHNVGALFRSADAVNLERILLCGLTPVPPRLEIEKTALGATDTVPWQYYPGTLEAVTTLQQAGYTLYALEQTPQAQDIVQTDLTAPAALILGHEREGIAPDILAAADIQLQIPMRGKSAHSLNVSTAGTVALYEFARQLWYH